MVLFSLYDGDDTGMGSAWRDFDISITVFHEQRSSVPIAYMDDQGTLKAEQADSNFEGRFPLTVTAIPAKNAQGLPNTAEQNALKQWFPTPFMQFQVELQWSSASNLPFFRAAHIRIKPSN
jgi:hypothetical protein